MAIDSTESGPAQTGTSSNESTWGLLAVSAGLVLGITPAQVVPILLGAAVESGFPLPWAAGLATAELGSLAWMSWWIGSRLDPTRASGAMMPAFVAVAVGTGLSAVFAAPEWALLLLATRALVGLAEGYVVAMIYATIAGLPNAQALYGRALQLVILLSVGVLPALAAVARFGLAGVYGGLAVLAALLAAVFFVARSRAAGGQAPVPEDRREAGEAGDTLDVPTWIGLLGAFGAGAVAFGDGLIYAFVQRIGSGLGLESSIGWMLAASSLCGAVGAGLARRQASERARWGLLLGVASTMGAALCVAVAPRLSGAGPVSLLDPETLVFAIGVLGKGASYFFVVTLILGVVALWSRAGDSEDRGWAPTVGGLIPLFASLGPLGGAALLAAMGGDFVWLGVGSALASVLGLAMLWPGAGLAPRPHP